MIARFSQPFSHQACRIRQARGLMVLAALETVRHARQRCFDEHRAWAIRLFALTIGSWLYRMDYGFWWLITHGAGHTRSFDGAFDIANGILLLHSQPDWRQSPRP
jgi:hypothetical protein